MVLKGLIKDLRLAGSVRIVRRYFVINGFDGVIVMLGILFGFFLVGVNDIRVILSAGIGAAVAMCISGISGVYLSEKAEKEKELKDLEKAMVKKLDKTDLGEALKAAPLTTALVDGLSPFAFSLVILFPFILSIFLDFNFTALYYSSFIICALCLFVLGIFMGKTSKSNIWVYGIKTVGIGIITAGILLLLEFLTRM
ncbi:VIT1/CCC1 transporter family protein [candidate division KSB1 bacterium]